MDRQARLAAAYQRAYAAGEELLKALQEPVTPVVADQLDELVNRRDTATQEALELFQPGDQALLGNQLEALLEQQRALDAAMRRFLDELAVLSQAAVQAKSAARGARQVMDAGRRGRMLDEKR